MNMTKNELQELINELTTACDNALWAEKNKDRIKALTQISVAIGKIRKYPKYNEDTERVLDLLARPKLKYDAPLMDAIDDLLDNMEEDIKKLEEMEEVVEALKESYTEIKDTVKDTVSYAVDETSKKAKEVAEKAKDGAKGIERKARTALRNWIMKED